LDIIRLFSSAEKDVDKSQSGGFSMTQKSFKFLFLASFLVLTAMLAFPMGRQESVRIDYTGEYRPLLVDSKGMTLYFFKNDEPGLSKWMASGSVDNWPSFYIEDASMISGTLNAADFGTIQRADGSLQTTYKGYPLYYFRGDSRPGDINGHGRGEAWFVVNPFFFNPKAPYFEEDKSSSSE